MSLQKSTSILETVLAQKQTTLNNCSPCNLGFFTRSDYFMWLFGAKTVRSMFQPRLKVTRYWCLLLIASTLGLLVFGFVVTQLYWNHQKDALVVPRTFIAAWRAATDTVTSPETLHYLNDVISSPTPTGLVSRVDDDQEFDVGQAEFDDRKRTSTGIVEMRSSAATTMSNILQLLPTTEVSEVVMASLAAATLEDLRQSNIIPSVIRGRWQKVEDGLEIYLMSAFFDQRERVQGGHVRVIGIADHDVTEVYCLLWRSNATHPEMVSAELTSVGPTISPTSDAVYDQLIFSCPTDGEAPSSVTLVTSRFNFRPTTLLPVQLPVKPASPSEVIEFGHCLSIVYRKQDPYRLVEWLELHRMWGVGEFNVYTTAVDNITERILNDYAKKGLVRHQVVPSAVDVTDNNEAAILLSMSPVINDCMYRNLYRYRYIVCTDLDEMIVPVVDGQYGAMLKRASPATETVHSFLFRNAYFFLDFGAVVAEPWYLLTQRYLKRVSPSRFGYSSKSITRTLSCVGLQNHLCWKRLPVLEHHANWNFDVPVKFGKNHHYKRCHFDDYHTRNGLCLKMMLTGSEVDKTMSQFEKVLADRVVDNLIELDLAEPSSDDKWKSYNPVP